MNMLKTAIYRGYTVPKTCLRTFSSFEEEYKDLDVSELKKRMCTSFSTIEQRRILIEWHQETKLGTSVVDLNDKMEKEKIHDAIVVADEGATATCKEIIKNLRATRKIVIDIWTLKESLIFVPEHYLVPEHSICTAKEKARILKTYSLTEKQFPEIPKDDVMVKYLGASKGMLIRIIRPSETCPTTKVIAYRIVT